MLLGGTGSVLGGTDWYWLVLGATGSVYCGTGSEQGDIGCQCDVISENIWFTWCKPSNSSIFGEGKSDYRQTNGQTDRMSSVRLDPLLWKGSSKKYRCS